MNQPFRNERVGYPKVLLRIYQSNASKRLIISLLILLLIFISNYNNLFAQCTAVPVCPANLTFYVDPAGLVTIPADIGDGSSYASPAACGIVIEESGGTSFICGTISPVQVTLTARIQGQPIPGSPYINCTLNIVDTVDPLAVCPVIPDLEIGTGGSVVLPANIGNGSSTDNCSLLGVTETSPSMTFYCPDIGTNYVTLTATDDAGNTSEVTCEFEVVDNTLPVATCPSFNFDVYLDYDGKGTLYSNIGDLSSTDNCGIDYETSPQLTLDCSDVGKQTVTLTAYDYSGNSGSVLCSFIVIDDYDPLMNCNSPDVYLDEFGQATITVDDIDNGSYDSCGLASRSIDSSSFDCNELGINQVILTATDVNGNTASCFASVYVYDTVSPVANCRDINVYLEPSGDAYIVAADLNDGSYDNCEIQAVYLNNNYFTCSDIGFNTVDIYVYDNSTNSSSCTSIVTVIDTISPSAICQDRTVYLDSSGNAAITASQVDDFSDDECSVSSTSIDRSSINCSDINGGNGTTVILTVTDVSGNSSTCSSDINVVDDIKPEVICKRDTVALDSNGNATITANQIDGGSSDACQIETLEVNVSIFSCNNLGENAVILTAIDSSGNGDTCHTIVTIIDNTSPVIICPDDALIKTDLDVCYATLNGLVATATDNCLWSISNNSPFAFSDSNSADGQYPLGITTVEFKAVDLAGNENSCNFEVEVIDNQPPYAMCRDTQNVVLNVSKVVKLPASFFNAGSYDNCGDITLSADKFLFDCSDIGLNTVTLTVKDAESNSSFCQSVVQISELTKPVASCKSFVTTYPDENGDIIITKELIDNGSYDNCDSLIFSFNPPVLHCKSNLVTMTLTDMSGNTSSCSSTVVGVDTVPPTALCHSITLELQPSGIEHITVEDIDNGSWDGCGIASIELSQNIFSCSDLGLQEEILTVTDNSGNVSICEFKVDVSDPSGKCTPPCLTPENPVSLDIAVSSATVSWDKVPGAVSYIVRGCKLGDMLSVFSIVDTFYFEDDLRQASTYKWDVIAVCAGNVISVPSLTDTFTTDTCDKVTGLYADRINDTMATLHWDPSPNAIKYHIKGKPIGGGSSSIYVNAGGPDTLRVDDLIPQTTYIWVIYAVCDEKPFTKSARSDIDTFYTETMIPEKFGGETIAEGTMEAEIYPNPGIGEYYIDLGNNKGFKIRVFDPLQREIISDETRVESLTNVYHLDIRNHPAGVYFVEIISGDQKLIKRIIKE